MIKKVAIGSVSVFIVLEVLSFLVNGVLMKNAYIATQNLWRADMNSLMWIYHVINVVGAFFFTFIFSKGYEKKGIMEGVRYGFYIGVWMSIGMAYGTYGMVAIPYMMALHWFIYGIIEYIIAGVVVAFVFKEKAPAAA